MSSTLILVFTPNSNGEGIHAGIQEMPLTCSTSNGTELVPVPNGQKWLQNQSVDQWTITNQSMIDQLH
jgi:hypothetical protein